MKALQFGLIGKSLAHSFSKQYFTEKFIRENLPHQYELFPLENISEFPALLASHSNLAGLNVTIPYKESIIPFLDELHPTAAAVGAVNTIRIHNHKTTGFNTDVLGFSVEMERFFPLQKPKRAIILGTGGAAKAVEYVLKSEWNFVDIICVSRKPGKVNEISYKELSGFDFSTISLIVNATPKGMYPHIYSKPLIPYDKLNQTHYLFDLVYNPTLTQFLKRGKKHGAYTENGLGMLHKQAEFAWNIWTE